MRRYYSYPYKATPLNFPIEPFARKFSTFAVITCLALVFFNFGAHIVLDPKRVSTNKIEELARDYYENYYYDSFVGSIPEEDFNTAFMTYSEYGFPRVYLRELLLFDNGRHADDRAYFDGEYYCNTNHTSVIIMPTPPFGKKDYEIKYEYECWWNS